MLTDVSLQQLVYRILAFVLISGLHGFAIAGIARLLGDRGPGYDGRLTLNPFVHLHMAGLVAALFSRAGFIRPIALDHKQMRGGPLGVLVAILVPLALLVAFGAAVAWFRWLPVVTLPQTASLATGAAMTTIAECTVWYALFNLIPVPPLAAGSLLSIWTPKLYRTLIRNGFWMSFLLAALMIATGGEWLRPIARPIVGMILGTG